MLNTYLQWDRTRLPSAFVFHLRAVLHICVSKCSLWEKVKASSWFLLVLVVHDLLKCTDKSTGSQNGKAFTGGCTRQFIRPQDRSHYMEDCQFTLTWIHYSTNNGFTEKRHYNKYKRMGVILNFNWMDLPPLQLLVVLYYNHIIIIFSGESLFSACWVALL